MAANFVQKRLQFDEDVEDDGQLEENQENVDPTRFKKEGALDGGSSVLSPMAVLSQNLQVAHLEGGKLPLQDMRGAKGRQSLKQKPSSSNHDNRNAMKMRNEQPENNLPNDVDEPDDNSPKLLRNELSRSRRCLNFAKKAEQQGPDKLSNTLKRPLPMDNADIMNALARDTHANGPALIGDLSKPCALPVLQKDVRHRDLKTISSETLAHLLRGQFKKQIGSYRIIDCRYPYEYEGGHIEGAQNLYTQELIRKAFPVLNKTRSPKRELRNIFIFHCEFSSERGPKLMRFLRTSDRTQHAHSYPHLDYPEIYLLHNGYKEFFEQHSELCTPSNYIPMLAPAHNEEMRHFRAKTKAQQTPSTDQNHSSRRKSWRAMNLDNTGGNNNGSAPKKPRSRLPFAEM
ncbi:cdc25-like protein phosphatase twine [Scaptodrosophila lebanonensis]|uniref:protein-tyrosine-phosphatase n=1 Tax=Drosophila lebanonensis TaxID=7225 RepID=A0A6J2UDM0_DROLE|nr:cdc25-like protein phosphatase twine [Scaptodrosophila lebanonensis]